MIATLALALLIQQPAAKAAPEASELVLRERVGAVMGTSLSITVIGADPELLERAIDAAEREMRRVEDLMTDWRASPLMELNAAAGSGAHATPPELARLIQRSLEISELTRGAFDVTFAGVGQLWDFKRQPPRLPSDADVEAFLANVSWRRVQVDVDSSTVTLQAGTRIGLGGIAKGYGVDRAMAALLEHGIEHAVVDAGGDLKVLGQKFDEPWQIAIKHPRDRERVIAVLPVSNTCVVTSGDYERFFEHEGRRYHHILDPRTGYPSTGSISATVLAPDAAFADALATALCVLGPAEGLPIIAGLPRVEALIVDMEGEVHLSTGLATMLRTDD